MSAEDTLRILLGRGATGQEPLGPVEWKHAKLRTAWVRGAIAALEEAQRQMDERCGAAVSRAYVTYAAHNRLYVSISRARYRAILMGSAERGESPILDAAFNNFSLEKAA